MDRIVIASKVFRIGVQRLILYDGKFYVSIDNRTYHSEVEIPDNKVPVWLVELE